MGDFIALIGAAGNSATAVLAYILWRHETRLTHNEKRLHKLETGASSE